MGLRVLWISPVCPYPPRSGNHLRTFHLLRAVGARHSVTLVCPAAPDGASERRLREACHRVVPFAVPQVAASFAQRLQRRFGGLLTRFPHCFVPANLPALCQSVGALAGTDRFDVAVGNLAVAPAVLAAPARLRVLDEQNVEVELYRRLWRCERAPLRKLSRLLDWWAVADFERQWLARADAVTACSERDRAALEPRARSGTVALIPNGVDVDGIRCVHVGREPETLVLVGGMSYMPNVDGAQFLVREVLPRVWVERPGVRVLLVGSDPAPAVKALAGPRVEVTGTVPDVVPYLHRAALTVVPLRSGGGTRLKILEAMAAGTPVVSTRIGAEGLDLCDGDEIRLTDCGAAELARAILGLLAEPAATGRMAAAARRRVEQEYAWRTIGDRLSGLLERLASGTASHAPVESPCR